MPGGIEDVARLAGVSTATVSRAMRGLPNVSDSTRERVKSAAAMIGYVPSPSASSLASGRTRSIGVLTPWVSRWFFANVIEGAERELRAVNFDALLFTFKVERRGRQPVDVEVLRRRVDGVIVVGLPLGTYEVESLLALRVPVVFIGTGVEGLPTIRVDDYAVGRAATQHLIDLGHRHIGHVSGLPDHVSAWSPPLGRRRGWHDALSRAGHPVLSEWMVSGYFDIEGGRESTATLLAHSPELTAVFAASDEMAMGAILAARDAGMRVPEDLSVIGVDGHDVGELVGLTTISQPAMEQGGHAARLLLDLVAGGEPPQEQALVYPTELVVRTSTGPARE